MKECSKWPATQVTGLANKNMKAHGHKTKCKATACTIMLAVQSTMASGKITNIMARVFMNSLMALYTKASGGTIRCMELDFILIPMVESGKASTEMVSSKLKDKNNLCNKNKSNSERKSPNARSLTQSIQCCKYWLKVIRKP